MTFADFCQPIPTHYDAGSTWQIDKPPRVMRLTFTLMPAASTSAPSVQVSGFEDSSLLTRCCFLICDSCSAGQSFACGFIQIPPHDGYPCRPANRFPCRADRGLSSPRHRTTTTVTRTAPVTALRAMTGAPQKKAPTKNGRLTNYSDCRT